MRMILKIVFISLVVYPLALHGQDGAKNARVSAVNSMGLNEIRDSLLSNPPALGDSSVREHALLALDTVLTSPNDSACSSPAVISFYRSMIEKVNDELKDTVLTGASIWMMYNLGFVVKTPKVTFAFDLLDGYSGWGVRLPQQLVDRIQLLFVTHYHGDHFSNWISKRVIDNGGYVILPAEKSNVGNVHMAAGEKIDLLGLDIRAHYGLHSIPLRIYEVRCPDGIRIMHTGDNQTSETLPDVDSIDVLLLNSWVNESGFSSSVTGMRNCLKKLKPKVMIPGHMYELGHPNTPSNRLSYAWALEVDDVPLDSKVVPMAWGERYVAEKGTGPDLVLESPRARTRFSLGQNYPNPFNPVTAISYQLSAISHVSLKVYDILGREVATLVNEKKGPGTYEVKFDARGLSSGVYFYRLKAGSFVQTRTMVLIY